MKKAAISSLVLLMLLSPGALLPGMPSPDGGERGVATRELLPPSWPMIGRDPHHTGRGLGSPEGIYAPYVRWNTSFTQTSYGAVMGNFTPNVYFNSTSPRPLTGLVFTSAGTLYLLDGSSGEVAWAADFDSSDGIAGDDFGWTCPLLQDSDGDGRTEVLLAYPNNTASSRVVLYEPSLERTPGGWVWPQDSFRRAEVWNATIPGEARYSSPVAEDLNADGYDEVVIATNQAVFAINSTGGEILWRYNLSLPAGTLLSAPTIIEFNSRVKDVLLAYIYSNTYNLVALRWGTLLYRKSIPLGIPPLVGVNFPVPSPVVGDFTRSSGYEYAVVIPTVNANARVYLYTVAGTEVWNVTLTGGISFSTPAVEDLNRDGWDDLLLSTSGFDQALSARMYCLSGLTGETIWRRVKTLSSPTLLTFPSPPVVDDIDGNGRPDVVFLLREVLVALEGESGAYLWNLTSPPRDLRGAPIAGEINGKVFLDIFSDGTLISNELVDLTVRPQEIYVSADPVVEGSEVIVSAIVRNLGPSVARGVVVEFHDTWEGNTSLMGRVVLQSVEESQQASLQWTFEGAGTHTVTVIVDPENAIKETDESNNQAMRWIDVKPSFPDLTVERVILYRGDGAVVDGEERHLVEGETSRANVTVANRGFKKAQVIPISMYINGEVVFSDSYLQDIPPGGLFNISIPFTVDTARWGYELRINITVDPSDAVQELSESNNTYLTTQQVIPSYNPGAHYFLEGYVYHGASAVGGVRVEVKNLRSGSIIALYTSSEGRYSTDLATFEGGFREGDEVSIQAREGGLRSEEVVIRVYSEDVGRVVNLTLKEVPFREIQLTTSGGNDTVGVNETVTVTLTVRNSGNLPANVTLQADHPLLDGEPGDGWEASLSEEELHLDPSEERLIILSITSPTAERCPPGAEVSVRVSALCTDEEGVEAYLTLNLTVRRVPGFEMKGLKTSVNYDPNLPRPSFSVSLKNWGNVPLRLHWNVSGALSDYLVNSEGSLSLSPAEAITLYINTTTTKALPGDELLGVLSAVASGEGLEKSLVLSMKFVIPDLTFEGEVLLTPSHPILGEEITVEVTVVNRGSSPSSDFYLSIYAGSQNILRERIDHLMAGGKISKGTTWKPVVEGTYQIIAYVDPDGDVIESDEENNYVNVTLNLEPKVVLKRFDQASVRPVLLGRGEIFIVTLKNEGSAPYSGEVTLRLYLQGEGGERLLQTFTLSVLLNATEEKSYEIVWTPQDLKEGEVTVILRLEGEGMSGSSSLLLVVKSPPGGGKGGLPTYLIYAFLIIASAAVLFLLYRRGYLASLGELFGGEGEVTEEEELPAEEVEGPVIEEVEDEEILRELESLVEEEAVEEEAEEVLEGEPLEGVVLAEVAEEEVSPHEAEE